MCLKVQLMKGECHTALCLGYRDGKALFVIPRCAQIVCTIGYSLKPLIICGGFFSYLKKIVNINLVHSMKISTKKKFKVNEWCSYQVCDLNLGPEDEYLQFYFVKAYSP